MTTHITENMLYNSILMILLNGCDGMVVYDLCFAIDSTRYPLFNIYYVNLDDTLSNRYNNIMI